jgi:glycosyltransferase involved in cell wall biosynthesis
MKILFMGDALAEHLRRWSRFFADLGHEIHVITWNSRILEGFEPVKVHQLKKPLSDAGILARGINLFWLRTMVRRKIAQIQPDLIHAHSAGAYAWLTMLSCFRPFMVSPWGTDVLIDIRKPKLDRFFTVRTLKQADLIHCDGENVHEVMINLGIDAKKIMIVPFGVDVKKFVPGSAPDAFLVQHGLSESKVVVSTRTLNPVHNVETVIRSAPLVLQKVPKTKFLIVGSGSEEQALRILAESLGVAHAVIFTGHVTEHEMITCLQAASVYVSTSISESGLAASTAEAMACGLPVINTDTGDIRLWIREGEGGFIVPVKDPGVLAERIIYLLEHDEERGCYGLVNRETIEEHNNIYIEMEKMEVIYQNLIATYR